MITPIIIPKVITSIFFLHTCSVICCANITPSFLREYGAVHSGGRRGYGETCRAMLKSKYSRRLEILQEDGRYSGVRRGCGVNKCSSTVVGGKLASHHRFKGKVEIVGYCLENDVVAGSWCALVRAQQAAGSRQQAGRVLVRAPGRRSAGASAQWSRVLAPGRGHEPS
ncbi:hypothetical protein P8452_38932 [Trifolium repens]|nr:hypothetical protein P8452_38932 [Trifolium repens]